MSVSTYPTDLVERLTRERDEALAQVERLKEGYELGYREGGRSTTFDFKQLSLELDDMRRQRDELKAQVERLLGKTADRINESL